MRRVLPQVAVWIIALGIGLWSWGSTVQNLAANTPPARPLRFELPANIEGTDDALVAADAKILLDGESFWFGPVRLTDTSSQMVIMRVYPAEGRVDARWTFANIPEQGNPIDLERIQAAARSRAGELFVQYVTYSGGEPTVRYERYFILRPDGLEAVEAPPVNASALRGVAWMEEGETQRIELISQAEGNGGPTPDWQIYTPGTGWQSGSIALPAGCANCKLQVAYRQAGAWRLLYVDLPPDSGYPSEEVQALNLPMAAVVLADPAGNVLPLDLPTNRIDAAQDNTFTLFRAVFDPAAGNVSNDLGFMDLKTRQAFPYVFQDGAWKPVVPPDELLGDGVSLQELFVSQYGDVQVLSGEQSRWQPRYGAFPQSLYNFALLKAGERWMRVQNPREGKPTLRTIEVSRELSTSFFGFDFVIVPTQADGFWWVESIYRPAFFMRYDADLYRADPPNAFERFTIALGSAGPQWWQQAKWTSLLLLIGGGIVLLAFVVLGLAKRQRIFTWNWAWLPLVYLVVAALTFQAAQPFLRNL